MAGRIQVLVNDVNRQVLFPNINIVRIQFRVTFVFPVGAMDAFDFFEEIGDELLAIFDGFMVQENMQGVDRIGITIDRPNKPSFFFVGRVDRDPFFNLFERLMDLFVSDEDLLFEDWFFELLLIHVPLGGGGTKRTLVWSEGQLNGKRSRVSIQNTDQWCMWRAVVVSLAHREWKECVDSALQEDARKRYKKIARRGSAMQTRMARSLMRLSHTDVGNFDALIAVSNTIRRNITVFNIRIDRKKSMVEFRTRDIHASGGYDTTLYILRRENPDHFDAITSSTAFLDCSYYCDKCNVRSNNKHEHRCPGATTCWMCFREPDEHQSPLPAPKSCRKCCRVFYDKVCFDIHEERLCKRGWKCPKCYHVYEYSRLKEDHVCYESMCYNCRNWKIPKQPHKCFIQPKAAMKAIPEGRIRFFDFESDPTHGTLKCYSVRGNWRNRKRVCLASTR